MFLGFNGGRNGGPDWTKLSNTEKDFYVRYVVARLGPFANIAGWNYTWEVEGNTENEELGCMRLVKKYDVFNHLRTYEDEKPKYNEFSRPEYTFVGVENHRIHSDNREPQYWAKAWTHHEACLLGYVPGKPVYMVEGNALWRRFWFQHIKDVTGHSVTQDEVRQAAWACATAAASFTWCGHEGEEDLVLHGLDGMPFSDGEYNPYREAAKAIDLLTDIMTNKVFFYRMTPQDSLLSGHDNHSVWCLAEPGSQYLVFSTGGKNFTLNLAAGEYTNNLWIDAITGKEQAAPSVTGGTASNFSPPDTLTDWVLILRTNNAMGVKDKRNSDTDQLPKDFVLDQNYPNPFNPSTIIEYQLPKSEYVELKIYDMLGKEINTLIMKNQGAGKHSVSFNASGLSSGIYFYKISVGGYTEFRKMARIK